MPRDTLRRTVLRWMLAGTLAVCGPAAADEPVVILLSWDGVRHDLPDETELPGLERIERDGARAERLVPVLPANTFPNHVSMATGTYPDRHGIIDNTFRDRERGVFSYENDADWIEAEPLWAAAERQGVPAAVFFWVGSETDWRGIGARHRIAPFDSGVDETAKVDQILAWLALPPEDAPRLIMSWWHGSDRAAHRRGPDHASVAQALRAQDRELSRLLAALDARGAWPHTTLVIVSDHGMTPVDEVVPIRSRLAEAGIPARTIASSGIAHVFLDDPGDAGRAKEVLAREAGVEVHARGALPRSWRLDHERRVGDLVAVTTPPRTFYEPRGFRGFARRLSALLGGETGMHGYAPEHPDMGAIFYAMGRGVPAGTRLGAVRSIDVAPTVSRLLAIEPPAQSEGAVIQAIGEALPN